MSNISIKKLILPVFSVLLGVLLAFSYQDAMRGDDVDPSPPNSPDWADKIPVKSLEEYLWNVDVILVGMVEKQEETFLQDSGIPTKRTFTFPVTPALIRVENVVYGDVKSNVITLLQHGTTENKKDLEKFVIPGKRYVLLLNETTTPGRYWALNGPESIWEIENDIVKPKAPSYLDDLDKRNGSTLKVFLDDLKKSANNKKKPKFLG